MSESDWSSDRKYLLITKLLFSGLESSSLWSTFRLSAGKNEASAEEILERDLNHGIIPNSLGCHKTDDQSCELLSI